ncbi:MAG: chloride channel protein [Phycisphaerales bacterium]
MTDGHRQGLSVAQRAQARLRLGDDWQLVVAGAVLGVVVAFAALAFILPLHAAERALERVLHGSRDAATLFAACAPVVGACLTVAVYALFPMRARGHGVTQVLYAVHRSQSRIEPLVGVRQWLASTFTIASGGSAGPEGPIVTIGATIGSNAARLLGARRPASTSTLLGCGAAAGLSAVFAAPLTGIFFVVEVLLRDFSARTFAPVVVASVISFATVQSVLGPADSLFGDAAREADGRLRDITIGLTPYVLALAVACAVGAVAFMRTLETVERAFARMPLPRLLKPVIGAALLGLGGAAWVWTHREDPLPPFFGSGYWTVRDLIANAGTSAASIGGAGILLVWFASKAFGTGLTLGSGGAGGLFAPSLVTGAMIGGAMAEGMRAAGIEGVPAPEMVLAGMGCMVAATTHAPLAGAMLVYEVCRQETVILPVLLATVVATLACRAMHPLSIYTSALAELGVRQGAAADLAIMRRLDVRSVGHVTGAVVLDGAPGETLVRMAERYGSQDACVVDAEGRYRGMITNRELQAAILARDGLAATLAGDLMRTDLPTVAESDSLAVAFERLSARGADAIAVIDPTSGRYLGVLTRERLMQAYSDELAKDG